MSPARKRQAQPASVEAAPASAERESAAGVPKVRIDGEFTIYRAAELKPVLLAGVGQPGVVELDLSAVTDLDAAGIQLLMMAKKAALESGCELRLGPQSAVVADVMALLDLGKFFAAPAASSGTGAR